MCLNDHHPIAITLNILRCFERLLMAHIQASFPATLNPHQYAYWQKSLHHKCHIFLLPPGLIATRTCILECCNQHSMQHHQTSDSDPQTPLTEIKHFNVQLHSALPEQQASDGQDPTEIISTISLNTGIPQGCVPSPLHRLLTNDLGANHHSNHTINFADRDSRVAQQK